ncbi:MAG: hypothetical protein A2268_12490 [Candidatus Raymondbacteria bacterium RifOxyA12_full_50_37]|uniref:HTH araC/xylS-type domain-containing protein n=1 Tax=Candidatus Raymondbacteria bacterium RIFOXYD12_FULL_49_13 TaxID=1817890 RepID=A0A1F7F0J6_UNCRA|nr:MAG: hypothetical protein A2248_15975 [Candidatus Raymondbacteria bacterium RIFOXYA2_FULL_49_16]OGJ91950.1 MAG: hypothetical protein A2268_12490 [Candidatus Raymondbacteria bacterium RifOxyA12_full_50_37]OGJ98746.1 MAG: hypothetical protein A2487_06920 [Candidatus Raymondbacteria bacterium RifOxyC12_full_50_8]OGK00132.1 MAG: hypothetical protein A2519_22050 [Candidatus Raymondbacteria bacterium RIFOXYD12_FULL_49_13]OGK03995.1 MAG: hypothetical protein A2350_04190 [Candidatus Raymondbacteria 
MTPLENLKFPCADTNNVYLAVDRKTVIRNVSENAQSLVAFHPEEIIGKKLKQILIPLDPRGELIFTIDFFLKNQPCERDIFIKINHPFLALNTDEGIFLFSYSKGFKCGNVEYFLICLSCQSFNSPAVQRQLSMVRSFNSPFIVLDENHNIMQYNTLFLAMLNFPLITEIHKKNIADILSKDYKDANPFLFQKSISYIKDTASASEQPWKTLISASGMRNSFINLFIPDPRYGTSITNRGASFALKDPSAAAALILSQPINLPNHDIRIQMEMELEHGADLVIAFNHPPNKSVFFDPAYSLDLKLSQDGLVCQFLRRSAPIVTNTATRIKPGVPFILCITRIGAFFKVEINGQAKLEYADPFVIQGTASMYLYFYIWKKSMLIKSLAIMERQTLFNIEKLDTIESRYVSFRYSPDKLFSFYAEPSFFLGSNALVVHFNQKPMHIKGRSRDPVAPLLNEARKYIQDNFFRKIDFKSLAESCCISNVHFIRKFKELFGLAPKAYQTKLKLLEAQLLLKTGKYKVQEAGLMVGFDDAVNFQHVFKKHFQVPPGEFSNK